MNREQLNALIRELVNHGFIVEDNPDAGFVTFTDPTRCIDVDDLRVSWHASTLIDLIPSGYIYKSGYQAVTFG